MDPHQPSRPWAGLDKAHGQSHRARRRVSMPAPPVGAAGSTHEQHRVYTASTMLAVRAVKQDHAPLGQELPPGVFRGRAQRGALDLHLLQLRGVEIGRQGPPAPRPSRPSGCAPQPRRSAGRPTAAHGDENRHRAGAHALQEDTSHGTLTSVPGRGCSVLSEQFCSPGRHRSEGRGQLRAYVKPRPPVGRLCTRGA